MDVSDEGAAVEDVVTAVKDAIRAAGLSEAEAGRDLRVRSVQLVLHAVATASAGGGVEFRVPFIGMTLRAGASVTRHDTHAIDITLVPPDLRAGHAIRDGGVEEVLVESIGTIRRVLARAAGGEDPFELREGSIELSFAITRDGSVTLGFNGELSTEVRHTLRLRVQTAAG